MPKKSKCRQQFCPPASVKIADIRLNVFNYEDMGIGHFWAIDTLKIRLIAYQTPDSNIFATAIICGIWQVPTGATSPQSTTIKFCSACTPYTFVQQAPACGTIRAFEDFFFPAGTQVRAVPQFPTVPGVPPVIVTPCCPRKRKSKKCVKSCQPCVNLNMQGTVADLLLQTTPPQVGTLRISDIVQAFFTQPFAASSPTFKFLYYFGKGPQKQLLWVDETNQIFGDAAIGTNGCPQRVPSNPDLSPPLPLTVDRGRQK